MIFVRYGLSDLLQMTSLTRRHPSRHSLGKNLLPFKELRERKNAIIQLLINFIPLALAAIAPVGIGLVILLLTSQKGFSKAVAYLSAQALAFAIWGLIFLSLSGNFESPGPSEPSRASITIRFFLGILLLVIAVRIYFSEQDPDALPLKWASLIDKISIVALFFLNLFLSFLQLRFVLLIMIGTDFISAAQLPQIESYIGLLILLFVLLWPQLLPVVVFGMLSDRRDQLLKSLDGFLAKYSRLANLGLLGLVGIVLVSGSLIDLVKR